jgi:ComF family protein
MVPLLWKLKYGRRVDLAEPLGDALADLVAMRSDGPVRAVIPVPLHDERLAERGYNQSALLAQRVAQRFRVPFCGGVVRRWRHTRSQVGLRRGERARNVDGAFRCDFVSFQAESSDAGAVILVDDVCTTGATLAACHRALAMAGVESVLRVAPFRGGGDLGSV